MSKNIFILSQKQTGDNEQFHARTDKAFSPLHQGGKNGLKNDLVGPWTSSLPFATGNNEEKKWLDGNLRISWRYLFIVRTK